MKGQSLNERAERERKSIKGPGPSGGDAIFCDSA